MVIAQENPSEIILILIRIFENINCEDNSSVEKYPDIYNSIESKKYPMKTMIAIGRISKRKMKQFLKDSFVIGINDYWIIFSF